jgi:5-formyltetrahydrofolate cyclo-ligase
MNLAQTKTKLRQELRARVGSLSAAERAARAILICQRVAEQEFWKVAKSVLLYAPMPDEVNIWRLLERALAEGKILTLPRYDPVKKTYAAAQVTDLERDLQTAVFEVREPAVRCVEIPLAKIELALVPGVGFDMKGSRLGRGWGYYDRLLAGFGGLKCGIALDEQIAEEICTEAHDVRMEVVLTDARAIHRQG